MSNAPLTKGSGLYTQPGASFQNVKGWPSDGKPSADFKAGKPPPRVSHHMTSWPFIVGFKAGNHIHTWGTPKMADTVASKREGKSSLISNSSRNLPLFVAYNSGPKTRTIGDEELIKLASTNSTSRATNVQVGVSGPTPDFQTNDNTPFLDFSTLAQQIESQFFDPETHTFNVEAAAQLYINTVTSTDSPPIIRIADQADSRKAANGDSTNVDDRNNPTTLLGLVDYMDQLSSQATDQSQRRAGQRFWSAINPPNGLPPVSVAEVAITENKPNVFVVEDLNETAQNPVTAVSLDVSGIPESEAAKEGSLQCKTSFRNVALDLQRASEGRANALNIRGATNPESQVNQQLFTQLQSFTPDRAFKSSEKPINLLQGVANIQIDTDANQSALQPDTITGWQQLVSNAPGSPFGDGQRLLSGTLPIFRTQTLL